MCGAPVDASSDSGDEAVLLEREIGNQIVKLKDEANLVPQQTQQVAMAIDFNAVDRNLAAYRAHPSPPNRWRSVLLPQPDGPQRATVWPSAASKSTPFKTAIAPSS